MDIFTKAIEDVKLFFANPLDDEIKSVLEEMAVEHSDTDKYTKMLDNLESLDWTSISQESSKSSSRSAVR